MALHRSLNAAIDEYSVRYALRAHELLITEVAMGGRNTSAAGRYEIDYLASYSPLPGLMLTSTYKLHISNMISA